MLPSLLLAISLLQTALPRAQAADWPDLSVSPKGSREGVNDAALIVAIEDYSRVGDVAGAGQNADDWVGWFLQGRGVPAARIVQLRDADATDVAIRREAARVATLVKPGGTLWVLYIGHGAPSRDGRDGLLVGVDADRSAEGIYARSVPQEELFDLLEKGPQAQTVAVVDACFSGQSAEGAELVAGLQPLIPTALASTAASTRTRVLTATGPGEFSGPLPGASRPAFSYLALGALRGWADSDGGNGDGKVSASEVRDWVAGAMSLTVRGRKQTPGLLGEDSVLGRALDTAGPDLAQISRGGKAAKLAEKPVAAPSARKPAAAAGASVDDDVAALQRVKDMKAAREKKLTELVAAKQAEATAAWGKLSGVLGEGSPEEIAVVQKFLKTWTDARVVLEDAEGRHERAVTVAALDAAKGWMERSRRLRDRLETVRAAVARVQGVPWNQMHPDAWGRKADELRGLVELLTATGALEEKKVLFLLHVEIGRAAENQNLPVFPYFGLVGGTAVNTRWYLAALLAVDAPDVMSELTDRELVSRISELATQLRTGILPRGTPRNR